MSNDDLTQNLSANNEDDRSTQPTITAVFRLLQDVDTRVSGRFDGLENRLEAVENRIGGVEKRLEAVETRLEVIETRLEVVETRLAAVETRLEAVETRLAAVETRLEAVETRLGVVETRLGVVETRLGVVETRLDRLDIWLAREFASIDGRFIEMANEMKNGFIQFSDKLADQMDQTRLHRAADYDDLLRRMRRLESKSS